MILNKFRRFLSRHPIIYAFLGGLGVVIFWRGVWETMDFLTAQVTGTSMSLPWWNGPLSILISFIILMPLGIFVSSFIGNEVIISGLRGEKKLVEKTEKEIEREISAEGKVYSSIAEIVNRLKNIEEKLKKPSAKPNLK